jgi:hypothetical protein
MASGGLKSRRASGGDEHAVSLVGQVYMKPESMWAEGRS